MNTENRHDSKIHVERETQQSILREKLSDAMIPGFQAEFDPDEAEQVGAFQEDALSEQDAWVSVAD